MIAFALGTWIYRLVLLLLLALPLHSRVQAPAMLTLASRQLVHAPVAGVLQSAPPPLGQGIAAGAELFLLQAPDIQFQLDNARLQELPLRWQHERQSLSESLRAQAGVLAKQHEQALSNLGGWQREQVRATVTAPLAGVVLELNDQIHRDGWIAKDEWLALAGQPGKVRVEAYVAEVDLQRLAPGAAARFVPESSEWPSIQCRVSDIDRVNLDRLDHPALAKVHGGTLPTGGNARDGLIPTGSNFRVRLEPCDTGDSPAFELRGVAHIEGERISPLVRMIRFAYGVLIREGGF